MSEETNAVADGTDPVVENPVENASPKTFTAEQVEQIVKDRLVREQKKFAKEKETLLKQSEVRGKELSPNVEEDLRGKLTQFEQEKTSLNTRLDKYRSDSLRSTIERSLNAQNCVDTDLAVDHFLSRNLVHFDDDDQIITENANNSLDDLVKSFLANKPHLVRGTGGNGAGTKAPKTPNAAEVDLVSDFEKKYGINRKQYKR